MIESSHKPRAETGLPVPLPSLPPRLAAGRRPHGLAPGELVKLHHSLAESLDADRGVIAQFVAPEPNAPIEAVVYDLAYISASWLGKRVLFVNGVGMRFDSDQLGPTRHEPVLYGITPLPNIEHSITRVVGLELYQMKFPTM